MAFLANWLRDRRWKDLVSLLEIDLKRLTREQLDTISVVTMYVGIYRLAQTELSKKLLPNPENFDHATIAHYIYSIEDMAIDLVRKYEAIGLRYKNPDLDLTPNTIAFIFLKAAHLWQARLIGAFLPQKREAAVRVWFCILVDKPTFVGTCKLLAGTENFQIFDHLLPARFGSEFVVNNLYSFSQNMKQVK